MSKFSLSELSLTGFDRPLCPMCGYSRMTLARIAPDPSGHDLRRFECSKCEHILITSVLSDPVKSDAVKWLDGGHKPPK
jgi:hypothetical protein